MTLRFLLVAGLASSLLAACGSSPAPPPPTPRAASAEPPPEDACPPPPSIGRGLARLWAKRGDETSAGEPSAGEPTAGESAAGESAAGEPAAGDASADADAAEPDAPEEAEPPPVDRERLRAALSALAPPKGEDAVLLLGIHVEDVASYAPLYSGEPYPIDERPGYRTIVLAFDGQGPRVAADLPYLMVPQASGFAYYAEAEVAIDEGLGEINEYGFAMPHTFVASRIVSAPSPRALAPRIRAEKKRLAAKKTWGETDVESLLTITPRARCSELLESQVTGGALGFMATTRMTMSRVGPDPLPRKRLTNAELQRFAALLTEDGDVGATRRPDGSVNLDVPVDLWFRTLSWRKDVTMCIGRHQGRVQLVGSTVIPGNSARSFSVAFALGDAPAELAPGPGMPLDFAALQEAAPALLDAFVSPAGDLAVLLIGSSLNAHDATGRELLAAEIGVARPVMAEWASGKAVARWLEAARHE